MNCRASTWGRSAPVRRALQAPHPQRRRPRPGRPRRVDAAGARPPLGAGLPLAAPALPVVHHDGVELAARLADRMMVQDRGSTTHGQPPRQALTQGADGRGTWVAESGTWVAESVSLSPGVLERLAHRRVAAV